MTWILVTAQLSFLFKRKVLLYRHWMFLHYHLSLECMKYDLNQWCSWHCECCNSRQNDVRELFCERWKKQKEKEESKKTCTIWCPSVWPWRPQRSLGWDKELVGRVAPGRHQILANTDSSSARKVGGVYLISLPLSLSVQKPDRKVWAALGPGSPGVSWLAVGFLVDCGATATEWCQQKWKAAAVEPEKPDLWSVYDGLNLGAVSRAVEVHVGSLHNRNLLKVQGRDPFGDPGWLHTLVWVDL